MIYELFNYETELVEAVQHMNGTEAQTRNNVLRSNKEHVRWIKQSNDYPEE